MSKVKIEGNFRGHILSSAVGLTRNEFPQLLMELQAEELYEKGDEGGLWIPHEDPEETMYAYLVLVDKTGAMTKNAEQVQAALGWSGKSFAELNDTDYSNVSIQFRVEENTYNSNTSLQVSWINPHDADPTRGVTKLDKTTIKNLNAKHGAALRAFGKKTSSKPAATPAKTAKPKSSGGPPKKSKVEYTADAIWTRFQEANQEVSEEDLCTTWETVEGNIEKDTEDYTSADWKTFEETLNTANAS